MEEQLKNTIKVKCQQCGDQFEFNTYSLINLQKDQDLYEPLFSLDIFKHKCEKCGHLNIIQYDMMVVDSYKNYMIYLFSPDRMDIFKNNVDEYINKLKDTSPEGWKVFNESIKHTRVVNSINDLKEKLLIYDYNLNDKIIELVKRGLYENKFLNEQEFPYIMFNAIERDTLAFICIGQGEERQIKEVGVNIEFYNKLIDELGEPLKEFKELDFPLIDKAWAKNLVTLTRNN